MAVTTLDIVDVLYHRLTVAGISITGGIYKGERPGGSESEDIVINALPVVNGDLQQAIANVNIHPEKIHYSTGGVVNESFDWVRLNTVVKAVKAALTDIWNEGYNYRVQQDGLIPDQNFYNIRIEFISENF